jgi:hypothetical protein
MRPDTSFRNLCSKTALVLGITLGGVGAALRADLIVGRVDV